MPNKKEVNNMKTKLYKDLNSITFCRLGEYMLLNDTKLSSDSYQLLTHAQKLMAQVLTNIMKG